MLTADRYFLNLDKLPERLENRSSCRRS